MKGLCNFNLNLMKMYYICTIARSPTLHLFTFTKYKSV